MLMGLAEIFSALATVNKATVSSETALLTGPQFGGGGSTRVFYPNRWGKIYMLLFPLYKIDFGVEMAKIES